MCNGPKWKRENVADHKFDFIDVEEFTDNGFMMRVKYLWLYLIVLKSFLVYISDIFTGTTMLTTKDWSNEIFLQCATIKGCVFIPFNVGKWLFVGCILFAFLLLAYESRKAKKIIASRDISYAFTNVMANNYYSLRSYDCFCFFDHISNSTKTIDEFAFFIFFAFKSWKRLILTDLPRQTINALTLYAVYLSKKDNDGNWYYIPKYFEGNSLSTSALTITSFFTVAVCAGSLLILGVAGLCYIPLLCHIRGNLKEYCCHKVDKRIDDIMKRRRNDRAKAAQKEALGDFSHLKNKKGDTPSKPLAQPTLPNVSVDDDDGTSSMHTKVPAPSTYTQDYYYYQSDKDALPPMPAYNPNSAYQAPGSYAHYNPSSATINYEDSIHHPPPGFYEEDNESIAHLATSAAPFARDPIERQNSPYRQGPPMQQSYDAYDVYGAGPRSAPQPQQQQLQQPHRRSPPGSIAPSSGSGLAYDDVMSDYYSGDPRQGGMGSGGGYPVHPPDVRR